MVELIRRDPAAVWVDADGLDAAQAAAVADTSPLVRVLGAPGTGKTTVAAHVLLARVAAGCSARRALLIAPSRVAAGALREAVTARMGVAVTEPLARTMPSFGFGILRREAALRGLPAPRLISGPEQDVILRELLAGHEAGGGKGPGWPPDLQLARTTRGFRAELRDLLMRAVEHGLEPGDLARLGHEHDQPAWVAAASVLAEYDEVTAMSRPGAYDPAWVLTAAADLLEDDPDALAQVRADVGLIVVDDAQELTVPAARLLRVIVAPGVDLVLIGDPDCATQTFRGAEPRILARGWGHFGDGPTHVLGTSWRQPPVLRAAARRVAAGIGALGGGGHRDPQPAPGAVGGSCSAHVLPSAAAQAHFVAAHLRRAHLLRGVPYSRMAVLVRGASRTAALRRVLAAAGVPVDVPGATVPLRDEPAVRPLLELLDVVVRTAHGQAGALGIERALDVLHSPIGGADALTVRRARRALLAADRARGGAATSDDLLLAAVLPEPGSPEPPADPALAPVRRLARILAAGLAAASRRADGTGWAPEVTAESVLWAMWSASGLAQPWRRAALASGPAGERADRDLDAVVALFDAAAGYVDRLPHRGPDGFLEHVAGQDLAADSLVQRAPAEHCVTLTTPAGAAGREWDEVVIVGVQEGVWPDLRLRGSLLGSQRLVDVLTDRGTTTAAARAAVRDDEARLLLVAASRARRTLMVTAVRDEDEQPSPYLDLLDPPTGDEEERPPTPAPAPVTLAGVVARLRREVVAGRPVEQDAAVRRLAVLARLGVPGADPTSWWALRTTSDDRPLREPQAPVSVSPSRVESFTQCGLRWLLTSAGGESSHPFTSAAVGTLVHDIAAAHPQADEAAMHADLERRWPTVGLTTGWVARRQYDQARLMLSRFARYDAASRGAGWEVVGREVDARAEVGRARVRGRVDRLERDAAGRLRVVDLKTGSSKPSRAELEEHPQLGVYQVAVEHGAFGDLGSTTGGAALVQLGKAATAQVEPQEQRPLDRAENPRWAEELVLRAADGMAAASFTATVGPWCRTCPSRGSCPLTQEGTRW